jgi:hypothetical protein
MGDINKPRAAGCGDDPPQHVLAMTTVGVQCIKCGDTPAKRNKRKG